jgi:hypothetical protein
VVDGFGRFLQGVQKCRVNLARKREDFAKSAEVLTKRSIFTSVFEKMVGVLGAILGVLRTIGYCAVTNGAFSA